MWRWLPAKTKFVLVHFCICVRSTASTFFFRITGDLLELVNGHQTGFVRRFEIREKFLQRYLRLAYLPDTDVEYRFPGYRVEFESRAQRTDRSKESLDEFPSFGLQRIENMFAEHEYQLFERSGSVNIHEERVIALRYLFLMETVFDQPCLSHTSGRYDYYIAPVHECARKFCGFSLPVAKVVCGNVTTDNERVSDSLHDIQMLFDFILLQI